MIKTIKDTKEYVLLKSKDSPFISQIENLYEYADKFLPQINRLFSNYTGHGMVHSLNVADYMFEIIDKPELLSDLEIVTLIYSALLHDIGMAVTEAEIDSIKMITTFFQIVNIRWCFQNIKMNLLLFKNVSARHMGSAHTAIL